MSAISNKIAEVKSELEGATSRIQEDVANYEARIAQLQAEAVTQADKDELDALKASLAAIDPTNPNVLPE